MVSKSILNGVKNIGSKVVKHSGSAVRTAKGNTFIREGFKGFAYTGGMMAAFGLHNTVTRAAQRRKAQKEYDNKSAFGKLFSSRPR
tara:strand:- start:38 stop:295 length:258 start_codon:yes stop_codon:yes gene_type:complete